MLGTGCELENRVINYFFPKTPEAIINNNNNNVSTSTVQNTVSSVALTAVQTNTVFSLNRNAYNQHRRPNYCEIWPHKGVGWISSFLMAHLYVLILTV